VDECLISADCHLMEPIDLWSTRLPTRLRDQAVRLEYTGDCMHIFKAGGVEHISFSKYRKLDGGTIEHGTVLEERERALREDGVWGEVVHSNLAAFGYATDNELAFAHARVYNDYLVEVFGGCFDRHKPTAMLPLTDVDDAVAELERVAELGIRGVMPPLAPPSRYCTGDYDRVWAAAQANGMVVAFHVGAGMLMEGAGTAARLARGTKLREAGVDADLEVQTGSVHANRLVATIPAALAPQEIIADLVGGGVPERFPDLHFMIVEFNAYWLAGLMGALDKAYTLAIGQDVSAPFVEMGAYDHGRPADDQPLMTKRFALNDAWPYPLRPSDYIRRQVHCTFQDDATALALRDYTGVEALLWGSDYPHHEGTWPRTRDAVDTQFAGIPAADRAAITGGTIAKLFGFEPPRDGDRALDRAAASARSGR
jgi:predicted TIM-barrel fold metal-dependent hydrolase